MWYLGIFYKYRLALPLTSGDLTLPSPEGEGYNISTYSWPGSWP
jgi:hypothetical protein